MVLLSGFSNSWACYDENLGDKANFDNCSVAAEQGYASAQTHLGAMYYSGQGVIQDYKQAVKWYQKASEQGHAKAQYNLGEMYRKGQSVIQNYVLAHMWLDIAGSSGDSEAIKNRDRVANKMTSSQIQEAQKLANEWMANHE